MRPASSHLSVGEGVKRVCIVLVGGTEIYTLNLARELSRRGHEVFLFYGNARATAGQGETAWERREICLPQSKSRSYSSVA